MLSPKKQPKYIIATLIAGLLVAGLAHGETSNSASPIPSVNEGLRFAITPYLWLAGISGKVDYNNVQRVDTRMSSRNVLSNLSIGGMLDGEVHYNRWGIMGNAVFAKLSNQGSKSYLKDQALTIDSKTDSWLGVYTVAGTYTAYVDQSVYLDVLAGARFLNANAKVQLDASVANTPYSGDRTLYSSTNVTDAVAGLKGRVRVNDSRFYVPFYLDAGGGSALAKFTSQQALGVGYAFDDFDLSLVYNNLYYGMSKDRVSSYMNMSGPAVAVTFRF
jgi:hypothetical protein